MSKKSDSIEELPTHFLRCRALNHLWDEYIPAGKRKPDFGFRMSVICISCATERHEIINTWGGVEERYYEYPDGYQLSFSLSKSDARLEYHHRTRNRRKARRGELVQVVP